MWSRPLGALQYTCKPTLHEMLQIVCFIHSVGSSLFKDDLTGSLWIRRFVRSVSAIGAVDGSFHGG
jgi:hypothetical protein